MKTKAKKEEKKVEYKYSKEQIVKSKTFINNVDLLKAILEDNKEYTIKEVKEIINNFMKGKVN